MVLKRQLVVLILALTTAFGGILFVLKRTHSRETAESARALVADKQVLLGQLVELMGIPMRQFAQDYSLWDDMVDFCTKPDAEWPRVNLVPTLSGYNASALWVLRPDFSPVYTLQPNYPSGDGAPPPLSVEELKTLTLDAVLRHGFIRDGVGLIEVRLAAIQPSNDMARLSAPQGWLLVARHWSDEDFLKLSRLVGGRLDLRPPEGQGATNHRFALGLPGFPQRLEPQLYVELDPARTEPVGEANAEEIVLFVALGLILMALAVGFIQRSILTPLGKLGSALTRGDLQPLAGLRDREDEIGRLARLVESSFADRAALQRAAEMRVNLSRDLHDSVIQTLYASGMSLVNAGRLVRSDPAGAERQLEQVQRSLNSALVDVRAFMHDLESQEAAAPAFSQAVEDLVALMSKAGNVEIHRSVSPKVVARLLPPQSVNLLQILREALSNIIRHSAAPTATITLAEDAAGARLEIMDTGRGFDPGRTEARGGRGLRHFRERAGALGGTLSLESQPGHGTRLTLTFPLAPR